MTATYANGTAGLGATLTEVGNGALVIDGITLASGNRVLVKDQTTQTQNGIYTVTAVGTGGTPYVLTRATDADNSPSNEVFGGIYCFVEMGTNNTSTGWVLTSPISTATIGTDNLVFTQISAASSISSGTGLTLTGTVLSIDSTVATLTGSQTLTNKTLTSPIISSISNSGTITLPT